VTLKSNLQFYFFSLFILVILRLLTRQRFTIFSWFTFFSLYRCLLSKLWQFSCFRYAWNCLHQIFVSLNIKAWVNWI